MLKRLVGWLLVISLLAGFAPTTSYGQVPLPIEIGDRVYVAVEELHVYSQPTAESNWVEILPRGMTSQVVATATDANGLVWYYLRDSAFGWVPGVLSGIQLIIPYREEQELWALVDEASNAIEANPNDATAYFWRGLLYYGLNRDEEAVNDVSAAIWLEPTTVLFYDFLAQIDLGMGNNLQAAKDASLALELGRELPNTYNRYGTAVLNEIAYRDAIAAFDRGLALAPDYGVLYSNLGNAYLQFGYSDRAFEQYQHAIEADPYLALVFVSRGRMYYDYQDRVDDAFHDFNTAITVDPFYADAYAWRGIVYYEQFGGGMAGFDDFDRAIQLDPLNGMALQFRGSMYLEQEMLEEAAADLEIAVQFFPDSINTHFNLAEAQAGLMKCDKAIKHYTAVIASYDSLVASAYHYRGECYLAIGGYEEAQSDFSSYLKNVSLENASDRLRYFVIGVYILRSSADQYLKNFPAALNDFQAAYDIDPDIALSYPFWVSDIYGRTFSYRQTNLTDLEARLASDPTNLDLLLETANLYMELGYWDEGLATYDTYLAEYKIYYPESLTYVNMMKQFLGYMD